MAFLYRIGPYTMGGKNRVRMTPRVGIIAKNPKESSKRCEIVLPSISSFSSISEDHLWCPVRKLKWYISRNIRNQNNCSLVW